MKKQNKEANKKEKKTISVYNLVKTYKTKYKGNFKIYQTVAKIYIINNQVEIILKLKYYTMIKY